MITIENTEFKSAIKLSSMLNVLTKNKIVAIITKLDEYISPNLKKEETAARAADIILQDPMPVLEDLNKNELKLVKEFVNAGPNAYVSRRMRKMPYKLQKYALVLTHENYETRQWEMLMPNELRKAFAPHIDEAIAYKEMYPRKMTHKEKCMAALMECRMRNRNVKVFECLLNKNSIVNNY